jgi:hypothetical protein
MQYLDDRERNGVQIAQRRQTIKDAVTTLEASKFDYSSKVTFVNEFNSHEEMTDIVRWMYTFLENKRAELPTGKRIRKLTEKGAAFHEDEDEDDATPRETKTPVPPKKRTRHDGTGDTLVVRRSPAPIFNVTNTVSLSSQDANRIHEFFVDFPPPKHRHQHLYEQLQEQNLMRTMTHNKYGLCMYTPDGSLPHLVHRAVVYLVMNEGYAVEARHVYDVLMEFDDEHAKTSTPESHGECERFHETLESMGVSGANGEVQRVHAICRMLREKAREAHEEPHDDGVRALHELILQQGSDVFCNWKQVQFIYDWIDDSRMYENDFVMKMLTRLNRDFNILVRTDANAV